MIDLDECPCSGRNLDKLLAPMILLQLVEGDLHGYEIVRRLCASPLMEGRRPDGAGVYRMLRSMGSRGFLTATWETGESGPAKRCYHLTRAGRQCLGRWERTLDDHAKAIAKLLAMLRRACSSAKRQTRNGRAAKPRRKLRAPRVPRR